MNDNIATERLNPDFEDKFIAEKLLHLERYQFASDLIVSLHKNNKKIAVLDVACGTGYGTKILHSICGHVLGIDIDNDTIRDNKKRYKNIAKHFLTGSILDLPLKKNSVNFITCFETIEHISLEDGRIALTELYRVLKPGGTLLISSPNRFWMNFIHLIKPNPFHLHEYFPNELASEAQKAGFKVEKRLAQMPFIPIIYPLANRKLVNNRFWFKLHEMISQHLCLYFVFELRK